MDQINCLYWLNGYLEDRDSLTEKEIQRVKDMLTLVTNMPEANPSKGEITNMVDKLFPDLSEAERNQTVQYHRNPPTEEPYL